MRWIYGEADDGGSPEYCETCPARREPTVRCRDCNQPLVWPENRSACELYSACKTQWVYTPAGHVAGLNYAGVEAVMRLLGIDNKKDALAKLQILEKETLDILEQRRNNS